MLDPISFAPQGIALFTASVFVDSLRYKFGDHPKTQEIFGRLDAWAGRHGCFGLFGPTGIFGQYVIGTAELAASCLLLLGAFFAPYRFVLPLGAGIALLVMSGAIALHLFTPLGIDPNRDGGGLFRAACAVCAASLVLLILRADDVTLLGARLGAFVAPG